MILKVTDNQYRKLS